MRITRKVFTDLAIWQVVLGLVIGAVFPFFVMGLGVPRSYALTSQFIISCLLAGVTAGLANQFISHRVVATRLKRLVDSVERVLSGVANDRGLCRDSPDACMIPVDSNDEIGESARAYNKVVAALAQSMRSQAAVRSFSEMLAGELEIEGLADHALREFATHAHAAAGLIAYQRDGELAIAASRGFVDASTIAANDYVRRAMDTGERQRIAIPADARINAVAADFRPAEIVVLPIEHKGDPLGAIVLAATSPFGADEYARIDLFTQGLGLALNNAMAHDRLQRLAALDPLTGIYNRRFGLRRLREEFGRTVRAQSPLGVLMLDIDRFKAVNDRYGHLVGDRVLKHVATATRSAIREGDILLRYGGEELVVVLPTASAEDVRVLAERIRETVAGSEVADGGRSVRVTVSVGAVAFHPDEDSAETVNSEETLLQLADESLYRAKALGRNRVIIAGESALRRGETDRMAAFDAVPPDLHA